MAAYPSLFPRAPGEPVRVVVTGQVGVDKKPFLQEVVEIARRHGHRITLCNIGEMMYAEAPDVVPGRILDLPISRLNSLRRAVFKDVLALAERGESLIVNTHVTFRWRHGLFPAFDHDQMAALNADLYVTLVDNVDAVHERLQREHDIDHTLKDILVWREEEIMATEVLATSLRGHGHFYIVSRGADTLQTAESLYRLIFEPHRRKVYPSFPITHVMDMPDVLAEINSFRRVLAESFITFDPGDLDEKRLLDLAAEAIRRGEDRVVVEVNGRQVEFSAAEISSVASDIDGQIYARDFKLIDQSDMIVSYVPTLPGGKPGISSGVERELQHAHEATKEVYVIWTPPAEPSPFVTETATRVFRSTDEAIQYFQRKGYLGDVQPDLPGAVPPR